MGISDLVDLRRTVSVRIKEPDPADRYFRDLVKSTGPGLLFFAQPNLAGNLSQQGGGRCAGVVAAAADAEKKGQQGVSQRTEKGGSRCLPRMVLFS